MVRGAVALGDAMCRGESGLRWWKEHSRFPTLFDPDHVSSPNRPALKHAGIDPNINLIVPGRSLSAESRDH
jgi:hypothetical protein